MAEEIVNFYTSIFKNSKILSVARYDEESAKASGRPAGSVITASFEPNGRIGPEIQWGWLKDKFGLSWQIVHIILGKLMSNPDSEKAQRVIRAMLQMKKIEVKGPMQAYEQG